MKNETKKTLISLGLIVVAVVLIMYGISDKAFATFMVIISSKNIGGIVSEMRVKFWMKIITLG